MCLYCLIEKTFLDTVMLVDTVVMAKNYSHCPLKKRPVFILHEEIGRLKNYLAILTQKHNKHKIKKFKIFPQFLIKLNIRKNIIILQDNNIILY